MTHELSYKKSETVSQTLKVFRNIEKKKKEMRKNSKQIFTSVILIKSFELRRIFWEYTNNTGHAIDISQLKKQ